MRYAFMFILFLALAGPIYAVPTPSPAPSPTPIFKPTELKVNLYRNFTAQVTDGKLWDIETRREFTTWQGKILYVTDISWSCFSAVEATLEWDKTVDVPFDQVKFGQANQGKSQGGQETPKSCGEPGISPVLTTDRPSNGVVFIEGYMR